MVELGVLRQVPITEQWKHEARDFTPWLAENLDKLGEAIGTELELVDTEVPVGRLALDILARDLGTQTEVAIENQTEAANHGHLGQLLTYAAGLDLSTVVWVAANHSEEHRTTLEWLNRKCQGEVSFFGVNVELLQVDDSRPAVRFDVVVSPAAWLPKRKSPVGGKAQRYQEFFQQLIDTMREKHRFTGAKKALPQSFYWFSTGMSSVMYSASFRQGGRASVELYLDAADSSEGNIAALKAIQSYEEDVTGTIGQRIEWEALPDSRASRIAVYREGSIDSSESELASIASWMEENLLKFKSAFGNRIRTAYSGGE